MSAFLLDTNVLSEFNRRGNPDPRVKAWLETAAPDSLYVSVLTLAEIRFGIDLLTPSKRRTDLETWLQKEVAEWFEGRVLSVDQKIADRWGALRADAQRGRPLPVVDGLLAATALEHSLTVVSRNVSHFTDAGVTVVNPWDTPAPSDSAQ